MKAFIGYWDEKSHFKGRKASDLLIARDSLFIILIS